MRSIVSILRSLGPNDYITVHIAGSPHVIDGYVNEYESADQFVAIRRSNSLVTMVLVSAIAALTAISPP